MRSIDPLSRRPAALSQIQEPTDKDTDVKTLPAVLLLALSGCSAAAPDSSTLNIADRDFLPDSVSHLQVELDVARAAATPAQTPRGEVADKLAEVIEAELDAITEVGRSAGLRVPGPAEAIQHAKDLGEYSAPQDLGESAMLSVLETTNEDAITRARNYLERGANDALKQVAQRAASEREKLRPVFEASR